MDTIISTASTTWNTTIGFSWGEVIDYMVDLGKLVAGTGLGLLQDLVPVLLVLAGISAVVGLVYAFFRFFRH